MNAPGIGWDETGRMPVPVRRRVIQKLQEALKQAEEKMRQRTQQGISAPPQRLPAGAVGTASFRK